MAELKKKSGLKHIPNTSDTGGLTNGIYDWASFKLWKLLRC